MQHMTKQQLYPILQPTQKTEASLVFKRTVTNRH